MNLTPKQQSVLLMLTDEWQSPTQIAEGGNQSDINELIKDLIREGLVQTNPVVLGLYRLTSDGMSKKLELN